MYKLILLLCLTFTFCLSLNVAEAKRFGGGKSFGIQRTTNFSRAQSIQFPNKTSNASKWLAPLTGLITGGLLAYLLMGHGISSGIISWLIISILLVLIAQFIRNMMRPALHTASQNQNTFENVQQNYISPSLNHYSMPSLDFDLESFLRDAKSKFIRLQTAYDTKNLNDLREFTTPEVFAEIQLQIHERGNQNNQTEVVTLNAELVDSETESNNILASVRFSGLIREDAQPTPNDFSEIWHFKKENSRWFVAGLQQP